MAYDIVIGRSEGDRKKLGTLGAIFLGKHYVHMGQTVSLSSKIYMDLTGSHAVFLCGKRGSGKSYTMGVIAEGMADLPPEIKNNISVIMLDTMGIYWTMKYPNQKPKEVELLKQWGLEPKGLK
ncbi:ATP-binding protein, partial [Candidatus Woesearchaeota archaeon]|nr:ATP-binding protein [Candidatus Woesearchaeota archaeon]